MTATDKQKTASVLEGVLAAVWEGFIFIVQCLLP